MINKLQKDLDQLVWSKNLRQQQITNLFFNLEEVSIIFNKNIVFQNPFETLRVEISEKIFDFLDIIGLLTFRLSSKLGNTLILILLKKKVIILQRNKEKLYQQIEQLSKECNSQEANYLIEKFWRDSNYIDELNLYDIYELRSFYNPPQLVVKILELYAILLNYTKFGSSNNSRQLLGIMLDPLSFIAAFNKYDVTTISEKKLGKLQEIHQMNVQPELIGLRALRVLYQYMVAIVKLREQKQIQIYSELKSNEKLIEFIDRQIKHFNKILN